MVLYCTICSCKIEADGQYYLFGNMGPDIISIIENNLRHAMDVNSSICAQCFSNIMQIMSAPAPVHEHKLQNHRATNICVWCQKSIFMRRTHSLPEGHERRLISDRISPRNIPDGSLVCYACWVRVRGVLQEQNTEVLPDTSVTSINTNTCVWCRRSLSRIRRLAIPEGPERNEIIARIYPRETPSGGRVCYACWVAARRSLRRAETIDVVHQDQVSSHLHQNDICALCRMSLFRRQIHTLSTGPERAEVEARSYPREIPAHALLCVTCWTQVTENVQAREENVEHPTNTTTMQLDTFTHTTSSSSHCFVPNCANPERFCAPDYLRKQILIMQKVYVTENARICSEHRALYNWKFLDRHKFSSTFTKSEMESMLQLSVQEINHNINF